MRVFTVTFLNFEIEGTQVILEYVKTAIVEFYTFQIGVEIYLDNVRLVSICQIEDFNELSVMISQRVWI